VRNSAACHPERVLQSVRGDWWMRRGGGTGSGGATDLRSSHATRGELCNTGSSCFLNEE
jgi:hypothetical protein